MPIAAGPAARRSEREHARRAPPRGDRVNEHERDAEPDGEPDRDGDELERGLEAGEVRLGRGRARLLLRDEGEEPAVRQARRQLEEDAGDLRARGRVSGAGRRKRSGGARTMTTNALPLKNRPYRLETIPTASAPTAAEISLWFRKRVLVKWLVTQPMQEIATRRY